MSSIDARLAGTGPSHTGPTTTSAHATDSGFGTHQTTSGAPAHHGSATQNASQKAQQASQQAGAKVQQLKEQAANHPLVQSAQETSQRQLNILDKQVSCQHGHDTSPFLDADTAPTSSQGLVSFENSKPGPRFPRLMVSSDFPSRKPMVSYTMSSLPYSPLLVMSQPLLVDHSQLVWSCSAHNQLDRLGSSRLPLVPCARISPKG